MCYFENTASDKWFCALISGSPFTHIMSAFVGSCKIFVLFFNFHAGHDLNDLFSKVQLPKLPDFSAKTIDQVGQQVSDIQYYGFRLADPESVNTVFCTSQLMHLCIL